MIHRGEGLVVDASVAAKWYLSDETHADQAEALFVDFANGRVDLVAPAQIRFEVASAITVATQGQQPRLTAEQGREALQEFFSLSPRIVDDDELILSAYSLVIGYSCAIYDALYLALAQRLSIRLITADARFYRTVRELPELLWIGDYSPAA